MHLQNFVRAFVYYYVARGFLFSFFRPLSRVRPKSSAIIKYTPVKGGTKTTKDHAVVFSEVDKASGKFCFITLYAASPGTGSPQKGLRERMERSVVRPWSGEADPKTEIEASDGWTTIAGGGQIDFGGNKAIAFLTVVSGFGKSVSVLGVLNDEAYLPKLVAFNSALYIERGKRCRGYTVTPTTRTTGGGIRRGLARHEHQWLAREFQDNEVRANQTWIGKTGAGDRNCEHRRYRKGWECRSDFQDLGPQITIWPSASSANPKPPASPASQRTPKRSVEGTVKGLRRRPSTTPRLSSLSKAVSFLERSRPGLKEKH
jgi:hypothetical protein